jgi:hypothetical protein
MHKIAYNWRYFFTYFSDYNRSQLDEALLASLSSLDLSQIPEAFWSTFLSHMLILKRELEKSNFYGHNFPLKKMLEQFLDMVDKGIDYKRVITSNP